MRLNKLIMGILEDSSSIHSRDSSMRLPSPFWAAFIFSCAQSTILESSSFSASGSPTATL